MVVIKIEIWPKGDPNRAQEIGRVEVENKTYGDVSDYSVLCAASSELSKKDGHNASQSSVSNFNRIKGNVWDLAYYALKSNRLRRLP